MSRRPRVTPAAEPVILELYTAGKTYREIKRTVGCCDYTINAVLAKNGIPRRRDGKPTVAEKADVIMSMAAAGKTNSEIAEATGLSYEAIRLFRIEHGISQDPRKRRRFASRLDAHAETIRQMLADGANYVEIAEALGVWPGTVRRYCAKRGYAAPEIPAETREKVLDLARAGESWRVIAQESGLTTHFAKAVCRKAGLWPKPQKNRIYDPEDDEIWFPPADAPDYGDDFQLKPHHRERLEYVRRCLRQGKSVSGKHRQVIEFTQLNERDDK